PSVTAMQLTISKQTTEIVEVKITDFYSNTNTITLNNFMANVPVDNALFSFTPKEGITVIDNSVDNSNE
ncbi:MAG: outer-membrane lipoprotein carrier protein LolA, partial [Desulfovibrionaceae bacterium]|nr:outer-membrane lipoprotein carrier protein LolA [Desulfovibrionaceae bacterium]